MPRDTETTLTPRERERAKELAAHVYRTAFGLIDWEHDFDGPDAGFIAQAVEDAFLKAYEQRLNGSFQLHAEAED